MKGHGPTLVLFLLVLAALFIKVREFVSQPPLPPSPFEWIVESTTPNLGVCPASVAALPMRNGVVSLAEQTREGHDDVEHR